MLSSPDSALADRQPELPGLPLVFDMDALSAAARERGIRLPPDCEPSYVRFKPGTRCLVGYGPQGVRGFPKFYASAFNRGSAKLAKAYERKAIDTQYGPGRSVLEDQAVELCLFPNDDHLKVLIRFADPQKKDNDLAELLPDHRRGTHSSLTTIAYKPERRCVFRYESEYGRTALIKAYEKNGFDDAHTRARYFSTRSHIGGIQTPLAISERRGLIAMNWLTGRSMADEFNKPDPDLSYVRCAGALLTSIHALPPGMLPVWTHANACDRTAEMAAVLDVLMPGAASRARQLAEEVALELASNDAPLVVCHGDFHTRQILIDADGVSLLDLDEALIAPSAFDLGYFIARLQMNAARGEITEAVASAAAASLIDGYESAAEPVSTRAIAAFTALALLNVAYEPFRSHRLDWPGEITLVLDRVEQLLGAGIR